jgi:hypothetical protein
MEFEYFYKLEIQTEHNHTLIWWDFQVLNV